MFCSNCGNTISDPAVACPHCGAATPYFFAAASPGKDRNTYVLLGALLGLFGFPGIHNFYAGHKDRGLIQILVTVLSCWLLWLPMYIWTIVEICTETMDGEGHPLR